MIKGTPNLAVTATALAVDVLKQQDDKAQRDNSGFWPFLNTAGGQTLLAIAAIVSTMIGFGQWRRNRQDEQKKREEERFQMAATSLGSDRKEARIAGAIMLLTFLQPGYERFYRQAFDLAVAYLQPLGVDTAKADFVPLDPLRQALITLFKESFIRVRGEWKEQRPKSDSSDLERLGAIGLQLDGAYLVHADLKGVWMREASLRKAHLWEAKFTRAHLKGAEFIQAYLKDADFKGADLSRANFTDANLTGTHPEYALFLDRARMIRVVGLDDPGQRQACIDKGAIFDEAFTTSSPQPTSPSLSQSSDVQTPSALPAQGSLPSSDPDGRSGVFSPQQEAES